MADNRMFLLHKPTGKAVMIAKRYADEWYVKDHQLAEALNLLFSTVNETGTGKDDWTLAMEDVSEAPDSFGDWEYTKIEGCIQTLRLLDRENSNA